MIVYMYYELLPKIKLPYLNSINTSNDYNSCAMVAQWCVMDSHSCLRGSTPRQGNDIYTLCVELYSVHIR